MIMRGTKTPNFGQKPCRKCGQWVSEITIGKDAGRTYDNDGAWHAGRCIPNPAWQAKDRLQRAEWEAKNLIKDDKRTESRGYVPPYLRRTAVLILAAMISGTASAAESPFRCKTFDECMESASSVAFPAEEQTLAATRAIAFKLREIADDQKRAHYLRK